MTKEDTYVKGQICILYPQGYFLTLSLQELHILLQGHSWDLPESKNSTTYMFVCIYVAGS